MNFELFFGVVAVSWLAFAIWSNESWYRTCQKMNNEWYERLVDLYKRIEKLEDAFDRCPLEDRTKSKKEG